MSSGPSTVIGMPAYGRADTFARTVESLLGQTRPDLAVVVVDDRPTPEVRAIAESYAAQDDRLVYEANPVRLGMIANWRHAFDRGRELFPGSTYFAWASDHDVWHPRWLELLAEVLDAQSQVVLAYPQVMRVYRKYRRRTTGRLDTLGLARPEDRMDVAATRLTAGNTIYGLFRASALERVGIFRRVLAPDRHILSELALFGEFARVPEYLWYREVAGEFSLGRQRRMLFTGRVPIQTWLPVNLQHAGVIAWDLAVRGLGRPEIERVAGAKYAALYVVYTVRKAIRRAWKRLTGFFRPPMHRPLPDERVAEATDGDRKPGDEWSVEQR